MLRANTDKEVAALLLLEKKASMAMQKKDGGTALMIASQNGIRKWWRCCWRTRRAWICNRGRRFSADMASQNAQGSAAVLLEKKASVDMQKETADSADDCEP